MDMITKNDFVEIKYTGYSNGNIFDSNVEENIKKINPKESAKETIVIVGQGMLVPGLDNALEGKEIGKDYEVEVKSKDGFGDRKANLLKTIPLKVFLEKKMMPQPGMVFAMDDKLAKIVTVSGARVITDFNNPLAGKDLKYEFKDVFYFEN
jgi:FKBP-type peptidyl-prolyl cis-trans isomerase 2